MTTTTAQAIKKLIEKRDCSAGVAAGDYQRQIDTLVDTLPAESEYSTDTDMTIARLG